MNKRITLNEAQLKRIIKEAIGSMLSSDGEDDFYNPEPRMSEDTADVAGIGVGFYDENKRYMPIPNLRSEKDYLEGPFTLDEAYELMESAARGESGNDLTELTRRLYWTFFNGRDQKRIAYIIFQAFDEKERVVTIPGTHKPAEVTAKIESVLK